MPVSRVVRAAATKVDEFFGAIYTSRVRERDMLAQASPSLHVALRLWELAGVLERRVWQKCAKRMA